MSRILRWLRDLHSAWNPRRPGRERRRARLTVEALEKDRNRRYQSPSAFAADIQRHLHDVPVQACPPSLLYRTRKFARRNKAVLATVVAAVAAVLATAGSIGWVLRDRAARQEERALRGWDALAAARSCLAQNRPALARQKLAEARAQVGTGPGSLGGLAADIEAFAAGRGQLPTGAFRGSAGGLPEGR
jgi:hypothetical protein